MKKIFDINSLQTKIENLKIKNYLCHGVFDLIHLVIVIIFKF